MYILQPSYSYFCALCVLYIHLYMFIFSFHIGHYIAPFYCILFTIVRLLLSPLSKWHRIAVPYRDTTTDLRHVFTSSSSVCRNADSGRPFDPSFNTWRPSVSCGCRTRLELSAVLAASSPVTDDVQAPLENRTIRFQLYLTVLLHYQHACL